MVAPAVDLDHPVEPGPLELAVDVRREHPDPMWKTLAPAAENPEAGMQIGRPVVRARLFPPYERNVTI